MAAQRSSYYQSSSGGGGLVATVVAVFLGILTAVLALLALAMWMDNRSENDGAPEASAIGTHANHNTSLPVNSFAGVIPENALELAEAMRPRTRRCRHSPRRPGQGAHDPQGHGRRDRAWREVQHVGVRRPRRPRARIHVREGQTVEMTLTNGAAIPHSIDFHAARIAPNVAFKDVAPGDSFTFRFKANDPGAFMYHCGTKPVLAHIANGMYGALVVEPAASLSRRPTRSTCSWRASGTCPATVSSSRQASTWPRRGRPCRTGRRSTATRTST